MCGIVAYIGEQDATPIVVDGLRRLEYRGYDSAGIAILENNQIQIRRVAGRIANLENLVKQHPVHGSVGIGHTRWATHGAPNEQNAHPHVGMSGKIVIVHNGIVENYLTLREELIAEGVEFKSETDTETIAHLIEGFYSDSEDLYSAVHSALQMIKGAHGLVVMSTEEPDRLIAARLGNAGGVSLGIGDGEMFIASDIPAIVPYTRKMVFLESGQIAEIKKDGFTIRDLDGKLVKTEIQTIQWDSVSAEKGKYRHFMQKEIHEQVRTLSDTLSGRIDYDKYSVSLSGLNLTPAKAKEIRKIFITACGTAAYAGMVGKYLIEHIARIPVEVMVASEFRYSNPIVEPGTVVLAISQSGETADTLAAMEEARNKGATLWAIVNAIGSQAMRVADGCISMQVGPEIGVASTKAFTAPVLDLYMVAVYLADLRGSLSHDQRTALVKDLLTVPSLVSKALAQENAIKEISAKYLGMKSALYLGRGVNMPIAYEGALKLKEISYIHAEGYPAGEMKHGPIALVDKDLPVIVIATQDPWYDKMISQIEQAKARGASVLAVATEGDELIPTIAEEVLWVPETPWLLSPAINIIPLQLFAYHIAAMLGMDVDQPRNLAKSVTVE
ncbi:MAG: glutamine--fructose-6-phosphate transaminase (isomerizing) [Chloroflexi bacterium]|nr:glutamine--fructose-6-phosphate transaminase (isomerizing) [Chloroflexota bacterium]